MAAPSKASIRNYPKPGAMIAVLRRHQAIEPKSLRSRRRVIGVDGRIDGVQGGGRSCADSAIGIGQGFSKSWDGIGGLRAQVSERESRPLSDKKICALQALDKGWNAKRRVLLEFAKIFQGRELGITSICVSKTVDKRRDRKFRALHSVHNI